MADSVSHADIGNTKDPIQNTVNNRIKNSVNHIGLSYRYFRYNRYRISIIKNEAENLIITKCEFFSSFNLLQILPISLHCFLKKWFITNIKWSRRTVVYQNILG